MVNSVREIMARLFTVFAALLLFICAKAQQIEISPELALKNERSYFLIGELRNTVMLLRDRESTHALDIYDKSFEPIQSLDLDLADGKARIIDAFGHQGSMYVLFQKKEKKLVSVHVHKYTEYGRLQDSTLIIGIEDLFIPPYFESSRSESGNTIALNAYQGEKKLFVGIFDLDAFKTTYADALILDKNQLKSDGKEVLVAEDGTTFIASLRVQNFPNKKRPILDVVKITPSDQQVLYKEILLNEFLITDIYYVLDEVNMGLQVVGFTGEKTIDRCDHHFWGYIDSDLSSRGFEKKSFDLSLLRSVYGQQKRLRKNLGTLRIRNSVRRSDGGVNVFAEIYRTYSRRPSFPTGASANRVGGLWIDYYLEDILVFGYDKEGKLIWNDVLHKKQFSQDDNAVYSSFFVMKNPSSVRLIYNDEIKQENTVSEYVVSPTGSTERNSLFTTDSQQMQLRFRDGIQVSANELLIPSERQGKISIVRLTY